MVKKKHRAKGRPVVVSQQAKGEASNAERVVTKEVIIRKESQTNWGPVIAVMIVLFNPISLLLMFIFPGLFVLGIIILLVTIIMCKG